MGWIPQRQRMWSRPVLSVGETRVKVHVVPAIDMVSLSAHRPFHMKLGFSRGAAGGVVVRGVDQFEAMHVEHLECPDADRYDRPRAAVLRPRAAGITQ